MIITARRVIGSVGNGGMRRNLLYGNILVIYAGCRPDLDSGILQYYDPPVYIIGNLRYYRHLDHRADFH